MGGCPSKQGALVRSLVEELRFYTLHSVAKKKKEREKKIKRSNMRWCKCYSTMHEACTEGVCTHSRVSGNTFLLGDHCCFGLSLTCFAHLFSQPVPIPSGHFLPLKNTFCCTSPGHPLIHPAPLLLHVFSRSMFWHLVQSYFRFLSPPFEYHLRHPHFSQNCPQRLKWVRSHQEERSVINRHNWKGYMKNFLLQSSQSPRQF